VKLPRLREIRDGRALSQRELAEMSGVDQTTISHIETGKGAWPRTARKLAEALGVTPAELQEGAKDA